MALLSVIVPVYDTAPYLDRCFSSLAAQALPDGELEFLLVDDGSSDESGAICDAWAEKDPRFKVLHQANAGVSAARNAGLAAASGGWIGFTDSDDWIEAGMFAALLAAARTYDAQIAQCGALMDWPDHALPHRYPELRVMDRAEALEELLRDEVTHDSLWNKLFRRDLFEGISFPAGRAYEDLATIYRLVERADRMVSLPGLYYHYVQNPAGIMAGGGIRAARDSWEAAKARADDLAPRWPRLCGYARQRVLSAGIALWVAAGGLSPQERAPWRETLADAAAFARQYGQEGLAAEGRGLAGRFLLRLSRIDRPWAYRAARAVHLLYLKRHRM